MIKSKNLVTNYGNQYIDIILATTNNNDKICNWMMFLDNPNSKEVLNIMGKDKDIKRAAIKLKYLSEDEIKHFVVMGNRPIEYEYFFSDKTPIEPYK